MTLKRTKAAQLQNVRLLENAWFLVTLIVKEFLTCSFYIPGTQNERENLYRVLHISTFIFTETVLHRTKMEKSFLRDLNLLIAPQAFKRFHQEFFFSLKTNGSSLRWFYWDPPRILSSLKRF